MKWIASVWFGLFFAMSMTNASAMSGLAGSEWGFDEASEAFVQFHSDDKVSGNGGCNRFFGSFSISENSQITIGPLSATRMMCAGDEVMQNEADFFSKLEMTAEFLREDTKLTLFDANRKILLVLRQRDWD